MAGPVIAVLLLLVGAPSPTEVSCCEQHVTAGLSADLECRFSFHADSTFDFLPVDELTEPRGGEAQATNPKLAAVGLDRRGFGVRR